MANPSDSIQTDSNGTLLVTVSATEVSAPDTRSVMKRTSLTQSDVFSIFDAAEAGLGIPATIKKLDRHRRTIARAYHAYEEFTNYTTNDDDGEDDALTLKQLTDIVGRVGNDVSQAAINRFWQNYGAWRAKRKRARRGAQPTSIDRLLDAMWIPQFHQVPSDLNQRSDGIHQMLLGGVSFKWATENGQIVQCWHDDVEQEALGQAVPGSDSTVLIETPLMKRYSDLQRRCRRYLTEAADQANDEDFGTAHLTVGAVQQLLQSGTRAPSDKEFNRLIDLADMPSTLNTEIAQLTAAFRKAIYD